MPDEVLALPRTGKDLFNATRPFAVESTIKSWLSVVSTILALAASLALAAIAPWWPLRLVGSFLGALLFVRSFIMYHDFMHRALLRKSKLAKVIFYFYGLLLLSPPLYWRYSHNFHHGNVGKPLSANHDATMLVTSDIGSFPLMTIEKWKSATFMQRFKYRVVRHPLTLLFAYVTVFMFSLSLIPLLHNPRKYWDGALSLISHGTLLAVLWVFAGFTIVFYAFLLPFTIASAIGSYLFFAQHNYEGMLVLNPKEWTYYRGAMESSSFMKLGKLMNWFTGNIGYHHIHHLNPLIPFYRLPEAMAAVPELQNARRTSLHPRDILACLRLSLWNPDQHTLVSYREAGKAA